MSGFDTRATHEREASDLLGMNVRDIPKTTLATIAIYLALRSCGQDDFDGARALLMEEWATLHAQGIVATAPPKASR